MKSLLGLGVMVRFGVKNLHINQALLRYVNEC